MTEMCTAISDRDETLIGYLYDEIDTAARGAFEAHLAECAICRDEVDALRGVRRDLAVWAPPGAVVSHPSAAVGPQSSGGSQSRQSWWREIPAWAQVAAALLVLGVSAAIANLNVHYDSTGLTIRTGWKTAATAPPAPAQSAGEPTNGVSRAELVALEQRLRGELRTLQTNAHAVAVDNTPPRAAAADADLLRRVRSLVDDSEKRQQTELALRIGEVLRDVNAQRRADLVKIDRTLGLVENNLGVEVLKQRERVNYLMRANQTVPVR